MLFSVSFEVVNIYILISTPRLVQVFITILIIIAIVFLLLVKNKKTVEDAPLFFKVEWRIILTEKIPFYNGLITIEKTRFETEILYFLNTVRITGVDTSIDDTDKLLVAASAIIPIFAFKNWRYTNIAEVLLYPSSFNKEYETVGKDRKILGMVGNGFMNRSVILSKPALHLGFANETDKHNTAIHEFVHLIDKSDGATDGIPENLLQKQYVIPWINLMAENIAEINDGKSDIDPYGGTSKAEFFAVVGEYFFERPQLLKTKHPQLYTLLKHIFKTDTAQNLLQGKNKVGRNEVCSCNSGKKFKNCCGKK
ncbi:MAG: zinc-dependent peptidase [Bacteroidia bacterium]|nr:zinc-dependent peptidase [Bacteroidia bacterium]